MTAREVVRGGAVWTVTGEGYATEGDLRRRRRTARRRRHDVPATVLGGGAVLRRRGPRRRDRPRHRRRPHRGRPGRAGGQGRHRRPDAPGATASASARCPFDSAHKFMATFHWPTPRTPTATSWSCVKGAPDVLLDRAASFVDGDGAERPLDGDGHGGPSGRQRPPRQPRACACSPSPPGSCPPPTCSAPTARSPTPTAGCPSSPSRCWSASSTRPAPRPATPSRLCHSAGIAVKMITGDHATTAGAIAAELGIEGRVVTGDELTAMTDEELAEQIDGIGVCARVSPEHKVRVVEALKSRGHVVAMTGDGVNDAAALRRADIGVAMGITGTEVTKEAGDMVLTDDNFATIVGAVERGRTIYDNIVKFVRFQLSTNIGRHQHHPRCLAVRPARALQPHPGALGEPHRRRPAGHDPRCRPAPAGGDGALADRQRRGHPHRPPHRSPGVPRRRDGRRHPHDVRLGPRPRMARTSPSPWRSPPSCSSRW